jgi:hypothetical protein
MKENIINIENYETITQEDIPHLAQDIISKIRNQIKHEIYNSIKNHQNISYDYFDVFIQDTIEKALETFIFKKKHWQNNKINLLSYLYKSLHTMCLLLNRKLEGNKYILKRCCPGCLYDRTYTFISSKNHIIECQVCKNKIDELEDLKKVSDESLQVEICKKIDFYRIFSLYTDSGVRCPDCHKWIPESYLSGKCVACPYFKCNYFGLIEDFKKGIEPRALYTPEASVDIDVVLKQKPESANLSPEDLYLIKDEYFYYLEIVRDAIAYSRRTTINNFKQIQNQLMCDAFSKVLEDYPYALIQYLVYNKSKEISIQSKIFQAYVALVENALPFNIFKKEREIPITDLLDPDLGLFLGISSFAARVTDAHIIPNLTEECYVGSRKLTNYGPCYIGRLIDVIDTNGASILNNVIEYSFSAIQVNKNIVPGSIVQVEHFRIPSHYEMNNMLILQKIKNNICNRIKQQLKGKSGR